MAQQTITIKTSHGTQDIPAQVTGGLAVHQKYNRIEGIGRQWTITHVATGYTIADTYRRDTALDIRRLLLTRRDLLDFDRPDDPKVKKLARAFAQKIQRIVNDEKPLGKRWGGHMTLAGLDERTAPIR